MTRAAEKDRIDAAGVRRRFGVSDMTVRRWIRSRGFPVPHFIGEKRCWYARDVELWEAAEMARPPAARRLVRNFGMVPPVPHAT